MNTDTCFFFIFKNVFYYFWMIAWMKNVKNSKSSTSEFRLAFARFFANFSLPLHIKVLLIKKGVLRKY